MNDSVAAPRLVLSLEMLSAEAFRPFGDVIEAAASVPHRTINDGYAERYHALARIDAAEGGGVPLVNIFRARPRSLPMRVTMVERHTLGSQAFVPLAPMRFLVIVAPAGAAPRPEQLRCFLAAPGQGVNYARGTWHHPLIAIDNPSDFLVVDRGGEGIADDCDEHTLAGPETWIGPLP